MTGAVLSVLTHDSLTPRLHTFACELIFTSVQLYSNSALSPALQAGTRCCFHPHLDQAVFVIIRGSPALHPHMTAALCQSTTCSACTTTRVRGAARNLHAVESITQSAVMQAGGSAAVTCCDLPPSWAMMQLIRQGRIKWVPAAATPTAAAAGPECFTAADHGRYVWQHGPVDAWLCDNTNSSTDAAAARSVRADMLKRTWHARNQAKLLLDVDFAQSAATIDSSSSNGGGFGCLEFGFLEEQLSHSSSCHLQRHPVLADHDRLIRLSLSKTAAAAGPGGSSSSDDGCFKALKGVLTHGVMLAGRRYHRCAALHITAQHSTAQHCMLSPVSLVCLPATAATAGAASQGGPGEYYTS